MSDRIASLLRRSEDALIREWANKIYAERRTDLPSRLSYEQIVDHMPDLLDELANLLAGASNDAEIMEAPRHLRSYPQVRFYQGVLLDEVARELMLFRQVINDFLWREGWSARQGSLSEMRDALRRTHRFVDEMMAQVIIVYAASLRPPVETRTSVWPPPRRRLTHFPPT